MIERIQHLCEKVKSNWDLCQLFEGVQHASEKEYMAAETIHACRINHAAHGECFSFKGNIKDGGGMLVQNVQSYRWLVENGYFEEGQHGGKTIIIPTDKLLMKLERHVGICA